LNGQSWDPETYQRNAGFVSELGTPLIARLDPRPGERILDLGCGDGVLTERLAESGAEVVGVDASREQVEAARQRGLDARVMDGRALTFKQEFDAVFSNAALHWMSEPAAVLRNVHAALKPKGRFIGEMGGQGNVATISDALVAALARRGIDGKALSPWFFPDVDEYTRLMEEAGFRVAEIGLFVRPTPLPTGIEGWLETMARTFLEAVAPAERQAYLEEVITDLEPELRDAEGQWTADYVRLRFAAFRR